MLFPVHILTVPLAARMRREQLPFFLSRAYFQLRISFEFRERNISYRAYARPYLRELRENHLSLPSFRPSIVQYEIKLRVAARTSRETFFINTRRAYSIVPREKAETERKILRPRLRHRRFRRVAKRSRSLGNSA